VTLSPAPTSPVTGASVHPVVAALDRFFHFSERGSNLRTEILAGLATFSTLSYILVVNPMILSQSGMDFGALITATAVVGAVFTVMMGLWTNYPLAMAPAMGINALIAVQVCQMMHIPWQAALGLVFYSGVLFFLISVTGIRQTIIEAFPQSYKITVSAGIGFFIAFLGFRNGTLIVANPATISGLGNFNEPLTLLAFFGIIGTVVLVFRRVPGALVLSILGLTVLGLFLPGAAPHTAITQTPARFFDWPNSMGKVFLHLDLGYFWMHPKQCFPIILAILFGDLFSAMGTLLAVGRLGGFMDAQGDMPKLKQALTADATSAMGAAFLGTNTPIIYLESAAGVEQGGRTGLVSLVVAACYLLALFLTPVIGIIPPVATAPALIIIGALMMQGMMDLDLRDLPVCATALVTIFLMTLGSSSDGIVLGFVTCVILNTLTGQRKKIKPVAYVLTVVFLLYYIVP
jgi:AGZA family xanthine/uracil permease-like MFS transporter